MRYIVVIFTAVLLNACLAYGDDYGFFAPNETIACDVIPIDMNAVYVVGQHTCASGYYLPADADGCMACPTNGYCSGGTYTFNPNEFQGLILPSISGTANNVCADNFPSTMYAQYTVNKHTCSAGYYMPANTDGCVICPANSYCSGGTYTFNETVAQGVQSCSAGLYAPSGMWEGAQCGRILHIGDAAVYLRSTKKTTPSLNVDTDGDGLPDFFANATTADVAMNAATVRKLKMSYGGVTYSIYDDTIQINE